MPGPPTAEATPHGTVEAAGEELAPERQEAVLAFWRATTGLEPADAPERLRRLVCVLVAPGGTVSGTSSAFDAVVPLIGGRRLWIYRRTVAQDAVGAEDVLLKGTFAALERRFVPGRGDPLGVCVLLGEDERRRRPEAEWHDPPMVYAGYAADGRQVRVGWFAGARVDDV